MEVVTVFFILEVTSPLPHRVAPAFNQSVSSYVVSESIFGNTMAAEWDVCSTNGNHHTGHGEIAFAWGANIRHEQSSRRREFLSRMPSIVQEHPLTIITKPYCTQILGDLG